MRCCFLVSFPPEALLVPPFTGSPDFARRKKPRLVRHGGTGLPFPSGIDGSAVSSGDGDFSDVRGRKVGEVVTMATVEDALFCS